MSNPIDRTDIEKKLRALSDSIAELESKAQDVQASFSSEDFPDLHAAYASTIRSLSDLAVKTNALSNSTKAKTYPDLSSLSPVARESEAWKLAEDIEEVLLRWGPTFGPSAVELLTYELHTSKSNIHAGLDRVDLVFGPAGEISVNVDRLIKNN